MANVIINDENLTNIANAIRGKNGLTTTYKPSEMAAAITAISGAAEPVIEALSVTANGTYTASNGVDGYSPITVNVPQDGSPPESAFMISGDCSYRFANGGWDWFIEQYGNKIITQNIENAQYMFNNSRTITNIPFDINFMSISAFSNTQYMFNDCWNLINLPILNNFRVYGTNSMFKMCMKLRTIPEDYASAWNWNYLESQTGGYIGNQSGMFYCCYSLRSIPMGLISHGNTNITYTFSYFNNGFYGCYVIDELVNLPIPYTATWTSNAFNNTFRSCSRLKNMTFALNDGQPHIMNWKSQTIDLSSTTIGYASNSSKNYILNYNSGITADKEVTDDASYQALKDDPDWFTTNVAYSRYNHDSAVATINSLPDASAYLATAGGTNTIKFKGAAGSATDGGAISSLTSEEIAVATSRGWTVSLV